MKKIMIIGAGFLQDFVICRARELGYYTIAIDGNSEAPGLQHADKSAVINIIDPEACYDFAQKEGIDGVLTAATDFGVLSASCVAEKLNLPGLKYETAQRIKNKYEIKRKLIEACVDDTHEIFEVDESTNIETLDIQYPVMVKPCDGSGSRAARRVDDQSEIEIACKEAISASLIGKALIESFVLGKEYGAESLVVNGEIYVLGIMKKRMTEPPYYAELGHQIPSELPEELEQKVKNCVEKAIQVLGINHGAVNMDLIITDTGGVHIVDVGARMGGNMIGPCIIPIGTGINYMDNLIRSAVGDELDWNIETPHNVCSRILAFNQGKIETLPDFKELENRYGVTIYHHMHPGDEINEYHTNLDGCGYIIAGDSKTADTVLAEIAKYIKHERSNHERDKNS